MKYKDFNTKNESKVIFLNKRSMKTFIMLQKQKKQMGILTGSILSVFAVIAIFNQKIVNQNELIHAQLLAQQQNRGIASVGSLTNDSFQKGMQEKLLADVKKSLNNGPVLVGDKPSNKEQFLLATLGGNYLLEEKDGKISLTSLNEHKHAVGNMNSFAMEFVQNMLNADFKELKSVGDGMYRLTKQDGSVAMIDIRLDDQKNLSSIVVQ
ncbi:MAG: hypothetical protein KDD37_02350 [Bdellovibrionales bacterium]|nr:hypothetical protein [Bdellovibrionales bacterium]